MDKQIIIAQNTQLEAVKQVRKEFSSVDFSNGNIEGNANRVFFQRNQFEKIKSLEIFIELPPEGVGNNAECVILGSNNPIYTFRIAYTWKEYLSFADSTTYRIPYGEKRIYHIILSYDDSLGVLNIYFNGTLKYSIATTYYIAIGKIDT